MPDDRRLPAIIIRTSDNDYRKRKAGGSENKTFGDPEQVRKVLLKQCEDIKDRLYEYRSTSPKPLGFARLKYKRAALAKSHRAAIFTPATCPIVGDDGGPGELLILVSPEGLDKLTRRIRRARGRGARRLTGIESLEFVGIERRFPTNEQTEVSKVLDQDGEAVLKIRLLNFHLFSDLDRADLEQQLLQLGTTADPYINVGNFTLYAVHVRTMEQAMSIARVPAVERLELMPTYTFFSMGTVDFSSLTLPAGPPLDDLPIVGILDGGIQNGTVLDPLVWKRDWRVPSSEQNFEHGTAVGALVASGGKFTGTALLPRARLLDAAIMPGNGKITEVDLVERLEELLELYARDVKHWNLSLGRRPWLRPIEFSDLGQILDNFHKRFSVQFYCAAGNATPENWRMNWPPAADSELQDYISAPGDALCSITVGSCAPRNTPADGIVPPLSPSPYSARGPVTYGVVKPDLCVPEGNLMPNGNQVGMPTLEPDGETRSDRVGTSYAAPIASCVGAELQSCLALGSLPIDYQLLVARAMMIQHSSIPAVFGASSSFRTLDFYGYGMLGRLEDMLVDPYWRSTSLIIADLYPNSGDLVIDEFPYPDGLRKEVGFRGKLLLTMVSEPQLDPSFRVEYARSNVDVHLEVMKRGVDGKLHPAPPEKHLQPVIGYESELIREQHKWSPVKQYRTEGEVDCEGEQWRLRARLILRDSESERVAKDPLQAANYRVPIVIAVTIEDPSQRVRVNDEMVIKWQQRGYVTESVQVAPRVRAQFSAQI